MCVCGGRGESVRVCVCECLGSEMCVCVWGGGGGGGVGVETCEAAKASFSRPTSYLFFILTTVPLLFPMRDLKEEISSR